MSIKEKYKPVIDLMNTLEVENLETWEERGSLIIVGKARNKSEKDIILRKADEVNKENALDIRIELTS